MKKRDQNACLMVTSIDDDDKTHLTYIPVFVYDKIVDFFLKHGACNNNHAIDFTLDVSQKEFWEDMWKQIEADAEFDE
jgi:hypothetical protein